MAVIHMWIRFVSAENAHHYGKVCCGSPQPLQRGFLPPFDPRQGKRNSISNSITCYRYRDSGKPLKFFKVGALPQAPGYFKKGMGERERRSVRKG
jgi:hypothetical protein